MKISTSLVIAALLSLCLIAETAMSCRVDSEQFKTHVKKRIERLLDPEALSYLYWPDEPLDASVLKKAIGLNITMAETKFRLDGPRKAKRNDNLASNPFIEDIFMSCSTDRNRQYILTINLELNNPFKDIEIFYRPPDANTILSSFQLHLMQSTFLVQISQQIGYEECLHVDMAQLASNSEYVIECGTCTESQRKYLDRMFSKRTTHLDSELSNLLSDKLAYGLRTLLNQERLELELYLDD